MNYYERHLGDYAKDAGHLTMIEQGAYTLLLDRYYTTEQGIPADQAHRVCRARSKDEQKAVDSVLSEFFTLTDGVWINDRAEREITKMQSKVKAAQENGKRGGRPKVTQKEPSGFQLGSDSVTQKKALQSPDTSIYSVANATGAAAPPAPPNPEPPSPQERIFALGLPLLLAAGLLEKNARSMLGLMRKTHGDAAVADAVDRLASAQPSEPVAWLQAALKARPREALKPGKVDIYAGLAQ